jgi:hypothetical protein
MPQFTEAFLCLKPINSYIYKNFIVKQVLLAAIVLSILITSSCKKLEGDNQNLDVSNQSVFDLMSTKSGSWWMYGNRNDTVFIRYATGKDTTKLGLKYSFYTRRDTITTTTSPEFFGKNEGKYLTLVDLDGKETNYINYVFWYEGKTSWTNDGEYNSGTILGKVIVTISSSLVQTGLTITQNGKTYTNVYHVHSTLKAGALNIDLGTLDIWFSKNIGIIRNEADLNALGLYRNKYTDSLINYYIKP